MKITTLSRRLFAVTLGLLLGVAGAWADAISIPQVLRSTIDLSKYTSISNVKAAANMLDNIRGNDGNTHNVTYELSVSSEDNYVLVFEAGAQSDDAKVNVTIVNSSTSAEVVNQDVKLYNSGATNNYRPLVLNLGTLTAGTFSMTLTFSASTYWCCNLYNMAIYRSSDINTLAVNASLDLDGSYTKRAGKYETSNSNLGSNTHNGDNVFLVNLDGVNSAEDYVLYFQACTNNNANTNYITARIYNGDGTFSEQQFTVEPKATNNTWTTYFPYVFKLNNLTEGYKYVELLFTNSASSGNVANVKNVQIRPLSSYNTTPASSFNMSIGFDNHNKASDFSYDSGKIDSNQNNSYVTYYFYNAVAGNYVLSLYADDDSEAKKSNLDLTIGSNDNLSIATKTITYEEMKHSNVSSAEIMSKHTTNTFELPAGMIKLTLKFTSGSNNKWTCCVRNIAIAQVLDLDETTAYTPVAGLANVTMARTMSANQWQTFVAPFAMTQEQVETAFGSDVKVAKLSGKSGDALGFTTGDKTIAANVPVMIYPSQAASSITADGVTIVEDTPTQSESGVSFVGNYGGRIAIPTGAYFVADNQLYVANDESNNIKNWRAYFTIPTGARLSGMTFDNGETTGISATLMNSEESTVNSVFDLQGRRISQPQKGLYIVKGKKVIIK